MNNGRPLSRKQTVRLLIALTILAWATQTLLKQWGFGAELSPTDQTTNSQQLPQTPPPAQPAERFVPADPVGARGATLEIRSEATVIGAEVKLRQVCRWSDRDKSLFEPIGDLILARLAPQTPFKGLSVQEIRGILRDAGVNTAAINFAGAISCTVSRSDVEYDEKTALDQWINARKQPNPANADIRQDLAAPVPATRPLLASAEAAPATLPAVSAESDPPAVQTLRAALITDLAQRLSLAPETLQVDFKAADEKVLNISRPLFHFDIEPLRARTLGRVEWNVTIGGADVTGTRRVTISAEARAWQAQLVTARPLTFKQVIRPEDVVQRRALVDQLSDDPLLTADETVGQQASRELKPGTVMTAKMVDPVQLVKSGQFVTVTLEQGTIQIKTVARALESGCYGQTIRVKNEATREVFQVILTGPQNATMNLSPITTAGAGN